MTQNDPRPVITGVILAGGRSSRMGEDKAQLEWRGQTLLEHARMLLEGAGCSRVLISGRPDLPDGLRDSRPGGGPAHAILDALDQARSDTDGLLVIPVDMPRLTVDELRPLCSGGAGRARYWDGHPLPLWLPAGTITPPRESVWSIRKLLEAASAEALDPDPARTANLDNVNTPEEFTRLKD